MSWPLMLTTSLSAQGSLSAHDLFVYGLATWRVTHMLLYESGPWGILIRLRSGVGVTHNEDGEPETHVHTWTYCLWCLSVWVAIVLVCAPSIIAVVAALSAVAIFADLGRIRWQ